MADEVDVLKLRESADAATRNGEWAASLPLWETIRAASPDDPRGYIAGANALRELGRGKEAEAVLQDGVRQLPDNLSLAAEGAWMSTRSGATAAAASAWENIITRFPQEAVGYIGLAATLIDIKRAHIADVVLLGARSLFPGSTRIAVDCARVSEGRDRLEEARGRWLDVIERFPTATAGYSGLARVLVRLGRPDDAEETIEKAVRMFPDDLDLAVAHAEHAMRMRRWEEATGRWRHVLNDFLISESVRQRANSGIGEIELSRKLDAVDTPNGPGIVVRDEPEHDVDAVANPNQPVDIRLLTRVQGMGHDCEFGLLQRQHGFEPLSLLRWTGSRPSGLVQALENDFDGLGDPGRSAIEVRGGEYVFGSYEYEMITHTFMQQGMTDKESLFEKLCTRMSYLKRKFLEDLEEGGKVLLYKAPPNLDDETLEKLYAALQRHGTNFLLVAKVHDRDVDEHFIEQPKDGMIVAYRPASATRFDNWTTSTESWLTILRMSLDKFRLPAREDETVA
ncbi:MAG: tetratricopeptide repeat protein [Janthinobacterium lividum]